ncbi:2-dehydropantoate 2-reductase [Halogranum rubrum]|uniref:2-dehydropantoate 2-reductase n=1 Tax=Halogranum rubrum TaxID=553466 RepID=A0A1I4HHX7_9EURY|nr:ketopantoate reductase family protein [Halogranum rubrum]SFL40996.1 2-dehydropantoate 2-reductase [Halogranum rubrum]
MDIVVFGAGSLGSLVGGLLARVHEVTLVGRDPHVSRVRETGLHITGERTAHVHPDAVADGGNLAADLAIVTVKSFDTSDAADTLASGSFEAVLSLQNGLTEELLTTRLDAPVLAGTATYGARLLEPGQVECTGVGRVVLGALDGGTSSHAERIGKAFRDADIETLVASDMPRRRWEKLAVNAGINAVTALARVDNGALADGDAADVGHAAARETARVARAESVRLPNRVARDALDTVVEETAKNRSSMLQDVERDKRTEVDAISGVVVDKGDDHGIDVPTNRVLAGLLRAWESERGLR